MNNYSEKIFLPPPHLSIYADPTGFEQPIFFLTEPNRVYMGCYKMVKKT